MSVLREACGRLLLLRFLTLLALKHFTNEAFPLSAVLATEPIDQRAQGRSFAGGNFPGVAQQAVGYVERRLHSNIDGSPDMGNNYTALTTRCGRPQPLGVTDNDRAFGPNAKCTNRRRPIGNSERGSLAPLARA